MSEPIATPFVEMGVEPDGHVLLETEPSGVAVVRLNRPERRNAFDAVTIRALTEAFETLHAADRVRIVFLRGSGGTFSAGADLDWMRAAAEATVDDNREDAMNLARMLKALHDLPALTVALVEGAAFGGGAGLVAACDMAIATKDARVAFSEVKLGLTPATISPYVVRAIGPRNARRLFAHEALSMRPRRTGSVWSTRSWTTPQRWRRPPRASPPRCWPPPRVRSPTPSGWWMTCSVGRSTTG
jgi:methylglutaconyl-CoA hydratase